MMIVLWFQLLLFFYWRPAECCMSPINAHDMPGGIYDLLLSICMELGCLKYNSKRQPLMSQYLAIC